MTIPFCVNQKSTVFTWDAANFDGSTNFLDVNTFTGQTSSKKGTLSLWFKLDATSLGAGTFYSPFTSVDKPSGTLIDSPVYCSIDGGSFFSEFVDNTASNVSSLNLGASGGGSWTSGAWNHFIHSFDSNTSTGHYAINGTATTNVGAIANAICNFADVTQWTVGDYPSTDGNGSKWQGGLAEIWFMPGTFIDLSVSSNIQKFRSVSGHPVDLGTTGSVPTGSAPLMYLHIAQGESASHFATNRGTGGNLTAHGTFTTYGSRP